MASSSDLLLLINELPESLPDSPEREWKIAHSDKIARPTAEVVVGLLAGIATVTVLMRVYIHLRHRGKLFLDDYIVILATACLLVETAMVYHNLDMMYMEASLATNPLNIMLFTRGQVLQLVNTFLQWTNIWETFAWTSNYLIKLSFLAFFWQLVRNVSKQLNRYWWFVLCFTVAAWIFNSIENFVICGASRSLKCFPYPKYNMLMGGVSTATDVITDLMVISIPVLLLRKAQLRTVQKVRILTFLCLSLVMTAFAIARFGGGLMRDSNGVLTYNLIWTTLFLHIECSVAVTMGGVTAFRSVFARHEDTTNNNTHDKSSSGSSMLKHYISRMFWFRKSSGGSGDSSAASKEKHADDKFRGRLEGPKTTATLKGLRTFIKRNGRDSRHMTLGGTMSSEVYDPLNSVGSYHNYKRREETSVTSVNEVMSPKVSWSPEHDAIERPAPALQTYNIV